MSNNDFLGRGWSFPPSFDKSGGGITMVADEEDINQSLKILFNTTAGERVMLPHYGCNIREFLFKNIDTSFQNYMREVISTAILKYEPRIILNDLTIDASNILDGVILLGIDYSIRATNNRSNVVFPFYHNEGTLVNK